MAGRIAGRITRPALTYLLNIRLPPKVELLASRQMSALTPFVKSAVRACHDDMAVATTTRKVFTEGDSMSRSRRMPKPEHEALLAELKMTIEAKRAAAEAQTRLALQANRAGVTARALAEAIGEPEGTVFSWIRMAKAAEQSDETR